MGRAGPRADRAPGESRADFALCAVHHWLLRQAQVRGAHSEPRRQRRLSVQWLAGKERPPRGPGTRWVSRENRAFRSGIGEAPRGPPAGTTVPPPENASISQKP